MIVPDCIVSAVNLIRRAFPAGVPEDDYLPVLAVLYPFMADEHLAEVASVFVGRDRRLALNDVYRAGAGVGFSPEKTIQARKRLLAVGLDEWIQEEQS